MLSCRSATEDYNFISPTGSFVLVQTGDLKWNNKQISNQCGIVLSKGFGQARSLNLTQKFKTLHDSLSSRQSTHTPKRTNSWRQWTSTTRVREREVVCVRVIWPAALWLASATHQTWPRLFSAEEARVWQYCTVEWKRQQRFAKRWCDRTTHPKASFVSLAFCKRGLKKHRRAAV